MALNNTLIYDPRYHTFESWACLMVELYAAQQLSIPDAQTDWKLWGNGLGAIDVFTNEAIPRTEEFDNWFDWAAALVNTVNPPPQAVEEN
tara:strand:- start:817 stop:1086 length:270 start_codon:yes stop_codon:yes gene_type:complete